MPVKIYFMNIEKQKLAEIIRTQRAAKGYTQNDLAEKTGISLRSIQRIEKGEVLPRSFTVKQLASVLQFSNQDLEPSQATVPSSKFSRSKRIILSAGLPPVLLLLSYAYLVQSRTFPETTFELALFWAAVISLIVLLQWVIWSHKSKDLH